MDTSEGRHRLVQDQQLGVEDERARDADALRLPAGELVRQAIEVVPRKTHDLKIVPRLRMTLGPGADAMKPERLRNRNAHGHARIE